MPPCEAQQVRAHGMSRQQATVAGDGLSRRVKIRLVSDDLLESLQRFRPRAANVTHIPANPSQVAVEITERWFTRIGGGGGFSGRNRDPSRALARSHRDSSRALPRIAGVASDSPTL